VRAFEQALSRARLGEGQGVRASITAAAMEDRALSRLCTAESDAPSRRRDRRAGATEVAAATKGDEGSIPIVMAGVDDPVAAAVSSRASRVTGRNVTGVAGARREFEREAARGGCARSFRAKSRVAVLTVVDRLRASRNRR
jgi:hypothetical protein